MKLFNVVSVAALFGAVFSLGAAQTSSANVADDLNTNYNKIVNNCGSENNPAYECSGNLIRLTGEAVGYHVWDPSPTSRKTGIVSFTYLRHDIKVDLRFGTYLSGIIYYPTMLRPDWTDKAEVTCAFPIDGFTASRPDGCGRPDDRKTCQDLNIHTASSWYQDFMSRSTEGNGRYFFQCGFAMTANQQNTARDFNENLKLIKQLYDGNMYDTNGNWWAMNKYNEVTIKTWPYNANNQIINPQKLPIQAFFYTVKNGNSGLTNAQSYQKDYYKTTHIIVPIVKVNNDDVANTSFSYNPEDQGVTVTVADELNANYNKVVDNCGSSNSPAFQCSGVLFRQTSYSKSYHAWDPSPKSIKYGGVSFSYIRKDIQFRNFLSNMSSGFIYYSSQQAPSGIDKATISCAFPTVGWSENRPAGRCGASTIFPTTSMECQKQGIYTANDWYKKFSDPSMTGDNKFYSQCAFDMLNYGNTATTFNASITAHNLAYANNTMFGAGSNEIIVKTQTTDASGKTVNPGKLPLQAFYYQNAIGLTEAQKYQQDYYSTTGKIVPVVYMNTTNFNNISFEYKANDQVIRY